MTFFISTKSQQAVILSLGQNSFETISMGATNWTHDHERAFEVTQKYVYTVFNYFYLNRNRNFKRKCQKSYK